METIKFNSTITANARHFEYYITGNDGTTLAYKENGSWTINHAELALERLCICIKELSLPKPDNNSPSDKADNKG